MGGAQNFLSVIFFSFLKFSTAGTFFDWGCTANPSDFDLKMKKLGHEKERTSLEGLSSQAQSITFTLHETHNNQINLKNV